MVLCAGSGKSHVSNSALPSSSWSLFQLASEPFCNEFNKPAREWMICVSLDDVSQLIIGRQFAFADGFRRNHRQIGLEPNGRRQLRL